ncbi:MAG: hypothetical protein N2234_03115 [Planctomycetota bacterium]|nr:hypothetical protein [Planctomycetota bacterium]
MAMERTSIFLLVGLVIAICICIGLVYGIVKTNDDKEKVEKELAGAKKQAESNRQQAILAQQQLSAITRVIRGGEAIDLDYAKEHLLKLKPTAYLKSQFSDILKEPIRDQYTNLDEVVQALINANLIISSQKSEWDTQVRTKEEEVSKSKEEVVKAKDTWSKNVTDLRSQIQDLNARIEQLTTNYEERIKTLSEEKKRVQEELEVLQKQKELEASRLRTQIGDLRGRLERVLKKKPRDLKWADPDGEIYLSDMNLGLCWIDLGTKHHVQAGMIFEVFRTGKGGVRIFKGRIELRRISDDLSQCAILDCYDPENDPIVKGDFIISPLYERDETPILVFIGDFRNPYYSKRQLEKKLAEFGVKVEERVSVNTDWIVIGENPEAHEDYEKARFWNIPVMREEELLRYIGR